MQPFRSPASGSYEQVMTIRTDNRREIRAPRGNRLNTRSWQTEGPLRLLMNNLDPDVAERPEDLVVYGGRGKAARDWPSFDRIVEALTVLEDDQTLLVQSGKPVGVIRTHEDSPRVLIANSNLVGKWATAEVFDELERKGLMMFGQMTAGSWSYIGSQGIIGGTCETFMEAGRQHYGSDLAGRWLLTAGLGGMGGAQPLAGVMAGCSVLVVEARASQIERRQHNGYLETWAHTLDEAVSIVRASCERRKPVSVALQGNAVEVYEELLARDIIPDLVTDQTAAHDPVYGFLPAGWQVEDWESRREHESEVVRKSAKASMARHVRSMLAFQARGVPVFDYGNNIRQMAQDAGVEEAFSFPGFISAYIRPLFCRGRAQFRWVALSGDPRDITISSQRLKEVVKDPAFHRWLDLANQHIRFQGLPARSCWMGLEERAQAGVAINELVAGGEVSSEWGRAQHWVGQRGGGLSGWPVVGRQTLPRSPALVLMPRALILVGPDYQDLEVWYPLLRLKEAGFEVQTAGIGQPSYRGKFGYPIEVDVQTRDVRGDMYDVLVVPGGWAPDKIRMDEAALDMVRRHVTGDAVVGVICHGGWVLASADVARGRTVTGFRAIRDDLVNAGATFVDEEVVVDGNLVTSRKPDDLPAFCRAILERVAAKAKAGPDNDPEHDPDGAPERGPEAAANPALEVERGA